MALNEGSPLPGFSLPTDDGGTLTNAGLLGRTTVLYFYPKDDTSGCTSEAKAFRDVLPEFTQAGVAVVGVSVDPIASHIKFRAKHGLNFPLASDSEKALASALGLWVEKSMYGRKYMGMERATLLVDGAGVIRKVWRKVKVPGHVAAVLQVARHLAEQPPAAE
ncbi:MAG: peroxiredoxin [Rhodospirillales bacterium]